jgi:hypothetical protein
MPARTQIMEIRGGMAGMEPISGGDKLPQGSGGEVFSFNGLTPYRAGMAGMEGINADPPYICINAGQGDVLKKHSLCVGRHLSPPSPPSPPDCSQPHDFTRFQFSAFGNLSPPDFLLSPPSPPDLFRKNQRMVERSEVTTKSCNSGAAMQKTFGKTREMSIKSALEWAFGAEHASLDFDDLAADGARPGTSTIYRLMQQGQLGCKIDGGGRSRAADDAEVIANALAALPVALGGKSMAAEVASLARAGSAPAWLGNDAMRCVPRAWAKPNQFGASAKTCVVGVVEVQTQRGVRMVEAVACPVTYSPTAQQIAVSQRRYLDWYGCLLHMRAELRSQCLLTTIMLSDTMPPLKPWQVALRKDHKAA